MEARSAGYVSKWSQLVIIKTVTSDSNSAGRENLNKEIFDLKPSEIKNRDRLKGFRGWKVNYKGISELEIRKSRRNIRIWTWVPGEKKSNLGQQEKMWLLELCFAS